MRGVAAALANRLLERDDWTRGRLQAHAGKVARVRCGVLHADLRIAPDGSLVSVAAAQPDATLVVPLRSMLDAPEFPDRAAGSIAVSGDADFGAALVEVARVTPWLCESALARATGPIAAQRVSSAVKAAIRLPRYAVAHLGRNVGDYFADETTAFVRQREFTRHSTGVAQVQAGVDGLAARLGALEAAPPGPPAPPPPPER